MHKAIKTYGSPLICFFIIGIAIASAQGVRPGQNVCEFLNAPVLATQEVADYRHPLRGMMDKGWQTGSEQVPFHLPHLPLGDWNEAHTHLDRHTTTPGVANVTRARQPEVTENWHPRKIEYLEFVNIETLQHDRMQVVAHADFDAPILIKIARSPREIRSLQRETKTYRLLHGSGVAPEFLGHVTENGRTIGFMTEYIREVPSIRGRSMQGCLAALRGLHQRGIAHGDAHDGNCLIREDGSSVLIDFELAVETWLPGEFERDLDIMGRCIQAISGSS